MSVSDESVSSTPAPTTPARAFRAGGRSRAHTPSLTAHRIDAAAHAAHLAGHPDASFLQNPDWAVLKQAWGSRSVGFFHGDRLVGSALILTRRLPVPSRIPVAGRAHLAYVSGGPVLDAGVDLLEALDALTTLVRADGAFQLRVGPPGTVRRWAADDVRKALPRDEHAALLDLPPAHEDAEALALQQRLREAGWRTEDPGEEFADGQPVFQARIPLDPSSGPEEGLEAVLARMSSSSRKRSRRSLRAGLTIDRHTGRPDADTLAVWERLSDDTAARDGFAARPTDYFRTLLEQFGAAEAVHTELLVARTEGEPAAAAFTIRQGQIAWRPYSASSSRHRKIDAPRALQVTQIQDSLAAGCRVFDLGGVSGTLRQDHRLAGLTEFKTTQGADIVQTHGEWDLPLNRPLAAAFRLYMARR